MRIAKSCLVEGIPERGGDGFSRPWHLNCDVEEFFDCGRERRDRSISPDTVSRDIIDLLPSDPFGMDISTTFTAITGWLEDLEVDCGGYGMTNGGNNMGDHNVFAGWNFIWNKAVQFQALPSSIHLGDKSDSVPAVLNAIGQRKQEPKGIVKSVPSGENGFPHQALSYSLRFLGIRDLLSVERVCKSLQSTVRNDPLLWRNIHIDQPLNERICDDVLLQLANRAQGSLQSFSLVECPRITDDGLKQILETNPMLTKLNVPGCTRLSIEGIVNNLKAFNHRNRPGIKQLRIGGLYGIMEKHFEELKLLLGVDVHIQQNSHKSPFYHKGNLYLSCDDDRAIDIETCSKCQKLRLVYDCPSMRCQERRDASEACRACRFCIPRCVQCGCCINDSEYEETFCLEWLCSACSIHIGKCLEGHYGEDDIALRGDGNSSVRGCR